jgi:tetratricopeptide (TPR) repeat protein
VAPGTRRSWMGGFADTHRIAEREVGKKLSESEVSRFWYGQAFAWIRSHPSAWARLLLRKLQLFWSPVEIPNNQPIWPYARQAGISVLFWVGFPVIACLGIAGLVMLRGQWGRWFLPIAFLVIYMGTVVAFFCNGRYRLPVVPVLIVLAAAGMVRVVGSIRSRDFGPLLVYLGVVAVVAAVMEVNPPNRARFRVSDEAGWQGALARYYSSPRPDGPDDWAKSAEHFRKAVELMPRHPESRLGLGRALVRLGRLNEAEKEFAEVVRQHPTHAEARVHYAAALAATGKPDQAIEQYQVALTLRPSYAEAREGLGCVLVQLGRDAEAIPQLRQALAIEPDLPRARSCLETAQRRQGGR